MKNQLFAFATLIVASNLIMSSLVFAQQELDKAQYRFYYEYAFEFDTITLTDTREDLIILQVGQNISKSFSYYTFKSDSLRATPDGRDVFRETLRKAIEEWRATGKRPGNPYSRRMSGIVYKNYSQIQMTVTDAINLNYYTYTRNSFGNENLVRA